MPQTVNLRQSYPGLNPAVSSVKAWLFLTPFSYSQPPAAVPTLQAEVALDVAHFVIYEGFTGKNATGQTLGRGSIDERTQTLKEAYPDASDVETLLVAAFPAPGPE